MNKVCRVKPDRDICSACMNSRRIKLMDDCPVCGLVTMEYELLSIGYAFYIGDYAMVMNPDGEIERVELDRVYDIKEKW